MHVNLVTNPSATPYCRLVRISTGELSCFLRTLINGPEMLRDHLADVRIAGLDLDIQPRQVSDRTINHVITQRWLYDYINSQCLLITLSQTEEKARKDQGQAALRALQTLSHTAD